MTPRPALTSALRGAPKRAADDIAVTDGQKLTIGDTTLSFYITPGHTAGTMSTIFRVTDHGVPHVVGFFGGYGSPQTEANRNTIIKSLKRWRTLAAAAGVDTMIANHQGQDHAVEFVEVDRVRRGNDPNPFVLGKDRFLRYVDVEIECTRVNLARHGEKIAE